MSPHHEARAEHRVLALLLVGSFLLRLVLRWKFFGFFTGDDVEILEAGFHRALGLTFEPWKIRNTLISDLLVAPAVWLAQLMGVRSSRVLCWLATWPFALLSTTNLWLLYRAVLAWGGERRLALASAALFATHWLPVAYGGTVYPRQAALFCLLLALTLVAPSRRSPLRLTAAGALLALGFAFRYSEVVYSVALGVVLLFTGGERSRRLAEIGWLVVGFALGALGTVGLYDTVIWGDPFASLLAFARFTLIERQSSSLVAEQPLTWYLWRLPHWFCPAALPFFLLASSRRLATWAWRLLFVPLLLLSLVHHKELRYLQGVVPFVSVVTAAGVLWLWDRGRRQTVTVLLLLTLGWSAYEARFLTKGSMAAVLAAEAVAAEKGVKTFAAPQLWAYGHRLVLGDEINLIDLPYPPKAAALAEAARTADRVALYEEDTRRDPTLNPALAQAGFCQAARFVKGRGKVVVLFKPCRG